jgi:hypothetical protein
VPEKLRKRKSHLTISDAFETSKAVLNIINSHRTRRPLTTMITFLIIWDVTEPLLNFLFQCHIV